MFADRDRRARLVSSSPVVTSPNSSCRRRSPRPLEFCADFLAHPLNTVCLERPIRRSLIESRDGNSCVARRSCWETESFQRQDSPGWPGRNGILLEVLCRLGDLPFARPRGVVLLRTPPLWNRIILYPTSGCRDLRIHC